MSNQHGKDGAAAVALFVCALGSVTSAVASSDQAAPARTAFAARVAALSVKSTAVVGGNADRKKDNYRIAQFKNY